ncbi:MAG TPA: indole-3-glycerol phosphate synthase TrpC [Acidimicrobiaceae bacterium]|nr:indole-3-glycerol phosphate synthase TrpC [Acidimicrobiaceae bacterium]HAX04344.1 indole-3-glycerol phosphate synthase TrpC [Acidimicrobiaceae bacterium]
MTVGDGTYLDRIITEHRARALGDHRSLDDLLEQASSCEEPRGFLDALTGPGLSVIAEVKRRSPSKGDLFADLEPAVLAGQYMSGGAACLSVLTDGPNFGGSSRDLIEARSAVNLPVLRKDFTVQERDVVDARLMGADCVLLIVAALSPDELATFFDLARSLSMDALVEVHDEKELESALNIGADLIGVNQRDLVTFEVDHERASRMAGLIPEGVVGVAESGVRDTADAVALRDVGYSAILVGETLVVSGNPSAAVSSLKVDG